MNPAERRRVLAGLARLEERGIASVDGAEIVRFLHPVWLALAGLLAVGLQDRSLWRDLVRHEAPKFTLAALTASLLLDAGAVGGTRSLVDLLRHLGLRAPDEASLDLIVAVITALQSEPGPLDVGTDEVAWLLCAWEEAAEPVRLEFLDKVDFSRHPALLEFLWSQVIPPRWGLNSWRLRRAVCRRLIAHGSFSWDVLGGRWEKLVASGAGADLSTMGRDGPGWQTCGAALASLGWILPGVLLQLQGRSAERADRPLGGLASVFGSAAEAVSVDRPLPDLGLEISLAEGFKIAAEHAATTRDQELETIGNRGLALFGAARSWLSRLALLQAFGLSPQSAEGAARFAALLQRTSTDRQEHPFVREAAAVLMRGPDVAGVVGKDLWVDDPEVLGDGGLDLSPPAHQCSCEFRLCGPDSLGPVGFRHPSRAFVQRSEAVCGTAALSGAGRRRPFAGAAFRGSWQLLDARLGQTDALLARDR